MMPTMIHGLAPAFLLLLPAIALVDRMDYHNPNDHLLGETPESLDYTFLRRNCEAIIATIFE
ncbi:MAG: hypothetical protein ACI89X_001220 [Planctomycetota bacterium]|jgi:hypothetical protein